MNFEADGVQLTKLFFFRLMVPCDAEVCSSRDPDRWFDDCVENKVRTAEPGSAVLAAS
jgi:hypothetical protein